MLSALEIAIPLAAARRSEVLAPDVVGSKPGPNSGRIARKAVATVTATAIATAQHAMMVVCLAGPRIGSA
jgi:hypothetical protein